MLKKTLLLSAFWMLTLTLNSAFALVPIEQCGEDWSLDKCIPFCQERLSDCVNKIKNEKGRITPAYACCNACLKPSKAFRKSQQTDWESLGKCRGGLQ